MIVGGRFDVLVRFLETLNTIGIKQKTILGWGAGWRWSDLENRGAVGLKTLAGLEGAWRALRVSAAWRIKCFGLEGFFSASGI